MPEPRFPTRIPDHGLWRELAAATSPEYADSYLTDALMGGSTLTTHTVTAWERITRSRAATQCLDRMGITLEKPLPFGHADRPDKFGEIHSARPWQPPTEAEYPTLSLPEKILAHTAWAHEKRTASMRAMIGKSWDRSIATMGPEARELWDQAQNHEAEARRLRTFMKGGSGAEAFKTFAAGFRRMPGPKLKRVSVPHGIAAE